MSLATTARAGFAIAALVLLTTSACLAEEVARLDLRSAAGLAAVAWSPVGTQRTE